MVCADFCLSQSVDDLPSQAAQAMLMLGGGLESPRGETEES